MKRTMIKAVAWLLVALSLYWMVAKVDWRQMGAGALQLFTSGPLLLFMVLGYGGAFWLRSMAWSIQIGWGTVAVSRLWCYHHIGLLLNHLLPVKGGEIARAALLRKENGFSWKDALLSVAGNRLLDICGLLAIAAIAVVWLAPAGIKEWLAASRLIWLLGAGGIVLALSLWQRYYRRSFSLSAVMLTMAGWMLEAVVIWSVVFALAGQIGAGEALLVHVLTIVGQTFHVTPGGIGTYEAVMSTLLHQVAGQSWEFALQAAILSHGFKFLYSFVLGAAAAWRLSLSPLGFYRQAAVEQGRETQ